MTVPSPVCLSFASEQLLEQLTGLHNHAGIYRLSSMGAPPHLGWSARLQRRLARLLLPQRDSGASLLSRLRDKITTVEYWHTGSRLETSLLFYEIAKRDFPDEYRKLIKLRPAWLLEMASGEGFARMEVTNRLTRRSEALFGPFASRGLAQGYEGEVLGLFQLRRCTERLYPDPAHPGCIYGEMSQCLRPCQGAVSAEEYRSEATRVREFLETNGRSSLAVLTMSRDRAAEQMDFEQAAQLHKRLEKVRATVGLRDAVVREVAHFHGLALVPSTQPEEFILWPMQSGCWLDPIRLAFRMEERGGHSLDREIQGVLSERLGSNADGNERNQADHLSLFARWYYSSWRDGEWFPFESVDKLNYRKLVRAVSKLAAAKSGVSAS